MTININKVGMFIGATIAVAAGVGAAIVTAKVAIVALAVLALIGAVVFTVSCIRNCKVSKGDVNELSILRNKWIELDKESTRISKDKQKLSSRYNGSLSQYKNEKKKVDMEQYVNLTNKDVLELIGIDLSSLEHAIKQKERSTW